MFWFTPKLSAMVPTENVSLCNISTIFLAKNKLFVANPSLPLGIREVGEGEVDPPPDSGGGEGPPIEHPAQAGERGEGQAVDMSHRDMSHLLGGLNNPRCKRGSIQNCSRIRQLSRL